MKVEMFQCEECGSLVKKDEEVVVLNEILVTNTTGKIFLEEKKGHDFCGTGCLIRFLSKKLNPDIGAKSENSRS